LVVVSTATATAAGVVVVVVVVVEDDDDEDEDEDEDKVEQVSEELILLVSDGGVAIDIFFSSFSFPHFPGCNPSQFNFNFFFVKQSYNHYA
jgi:hypothetical protein